MSPSVAPLRLVAAIASALLLLLGVAGPALGHAELDTADPADKAVLETPPTTITLTFTEDLDAAKSSFKLTGPDGGAIGTGEATAVREMSLDGLELAPGDYLIKWTSASADDGDIERGVLTFTVAEAASTASPSPSPTVNPTEPSSSAAPVTPAPTAAASPVAPTPAPSAAPTAPASSTGDVLLPIVLGLILVGGVAAFVLRRSRGA